VVLPLDLLTGFEGNVYEMTCAAMKRGIQINLAGDPELEQNRGKVVSTALRQILSGKVLYRRPV
jgi:DNA-directed RNA polymerase subunit omega